MRRGVLLAAAGSGGKTTALGLLARELAEHSVLLTTTTHIFPVSPPRSRCLLKDPDELQLLHALRRPGVVCAGTHAAEGKLGPLPLPLLMRAAKGADITLCEADGALCGFVSARGVSVLFDLSCPSEYEVGVLRKLFEYCCSDIFPLFLLK